MVFDAEQSRKLQGGYHRKGRVRFRHQPPDWCSVIKVFFILVSQHEQPSRGGLFALLQASMARSSL